MPAGNGVILKCQKGLEGGLFMGTIPETLKKREGCRTSIRFFGWFLGGVGVVLWEGIYQKGSLGETSFSIHKLIPLSERGNYLLLAYHLYGGVPSTLLMGLGHLLFGGSFS